jgi:hypothetical protein
MFLFEFEEILSKKISGDAPKWQTWGYRYSLCELVFLFSYFSLRIVHTEEIKNKNEFNKIVNALCIGIDIIAEEYKCKYKNDMICLEKVILINMLRNAGTANVERIAKIRRDYGRKMLEELLWTDPIYSDTAQELAHILK